MDYTISDLEQRLVPFYAHEFYLKKVPIEIYDDAESSNACAIMEDEKGETVSFISLAHQVVPLWGPVEVKFSASKSILKDEAGMALLKKLFTDLALSEYEIPGSEYKVFPLKDEMKEHFGKAGYALRMSNCGDPYYVTLSYKPDWEDDPDAVECEFFVFYCVFLSEEEMKELEQLNEDDKIDYIVNKDDEEDCWLINK